VTAPTTRPARAKAWHPVRVDRPSSPLVSVIVIVHDDAQLLPVAVRSALAQTLQDVEVVVVDDASSDGSADVADRLAAADQRVRVVRRQTNSGGCSAPRNDGLDVARGRWVMFLDSDDELFPGAAAALVDAGERTGAEVASGLTRRYQIHARATTPWYPELYRTERVVEGLAQEPEILRDTLSTNKAFRRSFFAEHQLRFPEGMHYEDQVFTASMYLAIRRLVLVPEPVYRWNVRVDRRSITNRRDELVNLQHRLEANRRIDAIVQGSGLPEVQVAKDVKFVKHDLRLYLNELWLRDEEFRSAFVADVGGYLSGLGEDSWDALPPMHRVVAHLLVLGDIDGVLDAVEGLRRAQRAPAPLTPDGSRLLWGTRHHDRPDASRLDVTGSAVASGAQQVVRLDEAEVTPTGVRLTVAIRASRLLDTAGPPPRAVLRLRRLGVGPARRVETRWDVARHPEPGLWRATVDVPAKAFRKGLGPVDVWNVIVDLDGRRLLVGRPRTWQPLPFAAGQLDYTKGGDLRVTAEGSLRTGDRLENARLRFRHTRFGVVYRGVKAGRATAKRLIARGSR
jgi:CDP-glycerol glycerophosphotransferase